MKNESGWRELAICRGLDPSLFFPDRDDDRTRDSAKAICAICPVRVDCLEDALLEKYQNGIRGGMTPRERVKYRAARNRHKKQQTQIEDHDLPRTVRG